MPFDCFQTTGGGGARAVPVGYSGSRANVSNSCTIALSRPQDLDFGSHGSIPAPINSSTAISLSCPSNLNWKIGLSNGVNASGTQRRMKNPGGNFINYELYRNSARTQRWGNDITGGTDTASGSGSDLRVNVLVKPTRVGLKTNLVITTNRRTYLLELSSTPQAWMASVSWDYPKDRMLALQKQAREAQAGAPVETGMALEQIRFRYAVSGDSPPWKPLRAFDDGEKVYIQFPGGIAQGELPPLFVIGPQGDGQLVNYRFRAPYYVVDRLFGAAELRLGGDKAQVVRIERTDGVSAARRN